MIDNKSRYLELVKQALLNQLYPEMEAAIFQLASTAYFNAPTTSDVLIKNLLGPARQDLCDELMKCKNDGGFLRATISDASGHESEVIPFRNFVYNSHTMTSRVRLDYLQKCMEQVIFDEVKGDFIEVGAWKGGVGIFMRGFLAVNGVIDRHVWVADSFDGPPIPMSSEDHAYDFSKSKFPCMAISLDAVKALFSRYDLLDEQVGFIEGRFKDSLPDAKIGQLALLRLDGSLYESTRDGLQALYGKLGVGGFVIVDDYFLASPCKEAVDEFIKAEKVNCHLMNIDDCAVCWRKG